MEDDSSGITPERRHTLPQHSSPIERIKRLNKTSPFCGGCQSCQIAQTLQAIFSRFSPIIDLTSSRMNAWPFPNGCAAALFIFLLVTKVARTQTTDEFLDAKITSPPVPIPISFAGELKGVQQAIGVPLSLPDGFLEFLARKNPPLESWCYDGTRPKFVTRRDYLKEIAWNLQMTTIYDAKRKVLVMDFPWHKASPRSPREILSSLEHDSLTKPDLTEYPAVQAWSQGFDQLLGCEENYSCGWKLRVLQNCATSSSSLYLGGEVHQFLLSDKSGGSHFAVLIRFCPSFISGSGPRSKVVAYLFNRDGLLEDGGIFEAGYVMAPPAFKTSSDGRSIRVHMDINGEKEFGLQASLEGSSPSLDNWGELNIGTPSLDYDAASKLVTLRLKSTFIDSYDLQLQVDHGKFRGALEKNGVAMHPPDYSGSGMSAFEDALD
jgi:hypothetical protein